MFHYSYFSGRGREILADVFGVDDPFAVHAHDIVEKVLALGYGPDLLHVRPERFRTLGKVFDVVRDGQTFVVAVSRDAQEISVQEVRQDRYAVVG